MPTFNNARDLERHLKKALDAMVAETLITTQAELGSAQVSPVDTGRFRASWFAAEGAASSEVAPEAEAKTVKRLRRRQAKAAAEGTNAGSRGLRSYGPQVNAAELRVNSDRTYHLTNRLPYAQSVAIEGKVVSKPKNWFFDFINIRVPKIQNAAARVVKSTYEL